MRVFQAVPLCEGASLHLDEGATHHVARVMRARIGDSLTVFNGEGGEYWSLIVDINKKTVIVELKEFINREAESELDL